MKNSTMKEPYAELFERLAEVLEAYTRCKDNAHEMNYYFMPMDSAPRDGTMVLLMGKSIVISPHAYFENDLHGIGWCSDTFMYLGDEEFSGWFPIPKPCESNKPN